MSLLKVWREGNSNFWGEKGFIIQLVLKNIIVKCSQVYSNHCLQLFLSSRPVTHGTISHQLIINHCHLDPCHKEVNVLGRRAFDWLLHLVPVCPVVLKAEGESILIFSYIWLPFTPVTPKQSSLHSLPHTLGLHSLQCKTAQCRTRWWCRTTCWSGWKSPPCSLPPTWRKVVYRCRILGIMQKLFGNFLTHWCPPPLVASQPTSDCLQISFIQWKHGNQNN